MKNSKLNIESSKCLNKDRPETPNLAFPDRIEKFSRSIFTNFLRREDIERCCEKHLQMTL